MVDRDITQNNLSNQTFTQDSNTSSFSAKRAYHAQNIDTLKAVLTANGYTNADILKMTKNDMLYAYRLLPESALPDVGPVVTP